MDFAKAFDKVSHRRLLYKLKYYGIQTHTLNWIQAFLTDRTRTIVIDRVTSNTVPVTSGVPQGNPGCFAPNPVRRVILSDSNVSFDGQSSFFPGFVKYGSIVAKD